MPLESWYGLHIDRALGRVDILKTLFEWGCTQLLLFGIPYFKQMFDSFWLAALIVQCSIQELESKDSRLADNNICQGLTEGRQPF